VPETAFTAGVDGWKALHVGGAPTTDVSRGRWVQMNRGDPSGTSPPLWLVQLGLTGDGEHIYQKERCCTSLTLPDRCLPR
jgi:hypothetical protein